MLKILVDGKSTNPQHLGNYIAYLIDHKQIEQAGPDHSDIGRQRMRVDDGRNRVGRIVETVDELKAQGDQQRHEQQHERKICGYLCPGRVNI